MKYRKKPIHVVAIKLENNYDSIHNITKLIYDLNKSNVTNFHITISNNKEESGMTIETSNGTIKAKFGDYIIKDIDKQVYSCKPDIFEKTYEKVN